MYPPTIRPLTTHRRAQLELTRLETIGSFVWLDYIPKLKAVRVVRGLTRISSH